MKNKWTFSKRFRLKELRERFKKWGTKTKCKLRNSVYFASLSQNFYNWFLINPWKFLWFLMLLMSSHRMKILWKKIKNCRKKLRLFKNLLWSKKYFLNFLQENFRLGYQRCFSSQHFLPLSWIIIFKFAKFQRTKSFFHPFRIIHATFTSKEIITFHSGKSVYEILINFAVGIEWKAVMI